MNREDKAKHIFARNPKVEAIHFTQDDMPFYEKHSAQAHSQRQKDQKIDTIKREAKVKTLKAEPTKPKTTLRQAQDDILDGNVGDIAEKVQEFESVEDLDALAKEEEKGQARTGVKNAIAKRIEALSKDEDPDADKKENDNPKSED